MKKFFLFLLIVLVTTSCKETATPREQLKNTGLFGEHQLCHIESFGSVRGSVSGSFFLGIGSINGTIGSEYKLQFWWSPKTGEMIASTLSYSMFRFIIDDTRSTPTVEFIFRESWLNDKLNVPDYIESGVALNLNNFVSSSAMMVANVRISKKSLEKEVYLPKIK
jgi:hypothetical protein